MEALTRVSIGDGAAGTDREPPKPMRDGLDDAEGPFAFYLQ